MATSEHRQHQRALVAELQGTACRCGASKKAKQTFCRACYFALPKGQREALYHRVGNGYEAAYAAAILTLTEKGRIAQD